MKLMVAKEQKGWDRVPRGKGRKGAPWGSTFLPAEDCILVAGT